MCLPYSKEKLSIIQEFDKESSFACQIKKDDAGEDDLESASRGNWWQGTFYITLHQYAIHF